MRNTICLILLFSFGISKMEVQKNKAADEILIKIRKAEIAINDGKELDQNDLNEIVCLTSIKKFHTDVFVTNGTISNLFSKRFHLKIFLHSKSYKALKYLALLD